jgi:hypothetical protein
VVNSGSHGNQGSDGAQSDPLAALDEILGPISAPDPGADQATAPGSAADRGPAVAARYADVHAFVTEYLCTRWARVVRDPDNAFRWCARWWDHPAALDRLTALWQAYEVLRAEGGTGPARWWREHADPTLTVLTDPRNGPFAGCGPHRHQLPPTLPSDPVDDEHATATPSPAT